VQAKHGASVITVSRQLGSGGTNVAHLVAQALDYHFYDKEVVNEVAEIFGADPAQIASLDEQHPDVWGNLVLQLLEGKRPTEASYLRALVKVLRKIAKQGDAVILGRAATCVLPESFRVRVIAPEPIRIARMAELEGIDERASRRMIQESDRARARFIRTFFGCDPSNPLSYDLTINTEVCTLEHAANLVITGFRDRQEQRAAREAMK
jgi:cytidylate kinase